MQRFAKKVAVVTASTDGIGFAIAQRLLREGARVVVSSRKEKNVQKAVEALKAEDSGHECHGLVCHVAVAEDRKNLIAEVIKRTENSRKAAAQLMCVDIHFFSLCPKSFFFKINRILYILVLFKTNKFYILWNSTAAG